MRCTQYGHRELPKILLVHGAAINPQDKGRGIPLVYAIPFWAYEKVRIAYKVSSSRYRLRNLSQLVLSAKSLV